MKIRNILVPTDFSEHADAALETALMFATAFDAKLHLVHAYYLDLPPTYIASYGSSFVNPETILEPIRESAESSLQTLMKSVRDKGLEIDGRVVMEHPGQVILAEAKRLPADLIVMGTRGLTGLKHVVLGSTAERIVRLAPCPVVTVKSED